MSTTISFVLVVFCTLLFLLGLDRVCKKNNTGLGWFEMTLGVLCIFTVWSNMS